MLSKSPNVFGAFICYPLASRTLIWGASSHIPEASASEQWREYFSLKTDSQSESRHVWTLSPPTVALMTLNTGHSVPPCLTAQTVCMAPRLQLKTLQLKTLDSSSSQGGGGRAGGRLVCRGMSGCLGCCRA